jgi:hypothetical protein
MDQKDPHDGPLCVAAAGSDNSQGLKTSASEKRAADEKKTPG